MKKLTLLLISSLLLAGCTAGGGLSNDAAKEKVENFINDTLMAGAPMKATVKDVSKEKGLFKITVDAGGQIIDSYLSLDGSLFFPQAMPIANSEDVAGNKPTPSGSSSPQQAEAGKPKFVEGDFTDDDAILGDKNAPITMIEFSDYECPFCKRHFTQTFPQIKEKYIDTGKVKFIFRDFPLGFHDPLATQQAMAAECVREQTDDKTYFAYHDLLYENTTSNGSGMEKSKLYELAEDVGVNKAKFTECLDSEKFKDEVKKDMSDGQKAGVSGTPAFLINGQFISGAQPFSAFERVFEEELEKQE